MAKNMTRKGLAVSAALALGLSGFTALPASAAPGVIFQPASGSTAAFGVLGNQTFDLTVGITAGVASSNLAVLKYKIEKAEGFVVNWAAAARDGSYAGLTPGATEGSDLAYTAKVTSSTTSAVVSPNTPSTSVANGIKLNIDSANADDATKTVTITAFLDTVNDGVYDSVNEAGQSVTVSFIDSDDVTWTTAFTDPALGDSTLKATVTATPANLNLFQVDAQTAVAVGFGTRGSSADTAVAGTNTTVSGRDYSAGSAAADADADNDLDVSASPNSNLTAATYVAQALLGSTEVGSEVIKAVAAATVGEVGEATTTAGANFQVTDGSSAADSVDVRSTINTVPITIVVKDTASPKVALANASVKVTITEKTAAGNTDAATFTAGGQTLKDTTSSAEKIEFTLVSNASGEISFNVVASGAKAGDGFTVSGSSQGVSSAYATVYTWETAVATSLANIDVNGTGAVLKNSVGSTTTLNYAVVDQFGVLAQNSDLRIKATDDSGTTFKYGTVSNGRASVQYGPYTSAATKTIAVELQAKDTDENFYDLDEAGKLADYSSAINASNVSLVIGSSNSASAVTLVSSAGSSVLALNTNDQSSADTRLGEKAPTVISSGTIATLSGAVSDVTTAGTYSTVTLSAAGVLFKAGNKFSTGSITVQTSATGAYDGVVIYSNKSGKVTVTATAGSATKTLEVEFAAAGEGTGTVLTIDAPANVMSGSTWTATAKLVDKFGNAVDSDQTGGTTPTFSFSAVSPGIQVGSNPTATDADGLAKLAYFIGSNDKGTIVLTATYDADGNTATTTDKYTVSKNIVIGATAATQGTSVKRTGNTVAVRVTGANARIVLNGVRVASRSTAGVLTRTLTLRAGRNVIQLVVGGEVVRTVRYTR